MCEIQLIKRFDNKNLTLKDIDTFNNFMLLGHSTNSDAYGVFDEKGIIIKGNTELKEEDLKVLKGKHKFLVGHNRYKTTGCNKIMENNHPFETENFILVHNGVISNHEYLKEKHNLDYTIETDSYIAIALLEKFYKESNNLTETFKNSLTPLAGSYSLVIYHKLSQRLFYVKNSSPSFTFGLIHTNNGDLLIGTTDERNIELTFNNTERGVFEVSSINYTPFKPKSEVIYELKDDKISIFLEYDGKPEHKPISFPKQVINENKELHTDFGKKQAFKTIANDIINELTKNVKILTRAYYLDDRNSIILHVENFDINELELIQDMFYEYLTILYEPQLNNTKGKLTIEVDYDEYKKFFMETDMINDFNKSFSGDLKYYE